MRVLSALPWFVLIAVADAGYYKIRPPPPPPPPPKGSIHYGPHPPPHSRYPRPAPHSSHYPPPPPPHYPHHYHHSRPPMSPVKSSSNRHYQRYPLPPPKPVYPSPYSWKNYNTFRAPVIKETFSTPQTTYVPTFFKDDDKGPIHTIPAPNLGPADKPVNLFNPTHQEHEQLQLHQPLPIHQQLPVHQQLQNHQQLPVHQQLEEQQQDYLHHKKPLHSTEEDLAAVLKHGITKVNIQPSQGYQVTEDPSLHQPHSGTDPFFAPDPDPEVPSLKIPPTNDPHSTPSNGQVPLDLYLQQEAEKTRGNEQQQTNADGSDKLTAQELFNLLNYDPTNPVGLIPQAQLQQHVLQPNIQFYNPLLLPQTSQIDNSQNILNQQASQHFAPQYQTFNYDEQTQQGAYGSDSFPHSSMNLNLQGAEELSHGSLNEDKTGLEDNDVAGSENEQAFDRVSENEIVNSRPEERKIPPSSKDTPGLGKNHAGNKQQQTVVTGSSTYHSSAIPIQVTMEKQHKQESFNDQAESNKQSGEDPEEQEESAPTQATPNNQMKPDDNVQLQKSIQIYENTYSSNEDLIQQEIKNLNEYGNDYTDEEKIVKGMVLGQPVETHENKQFNKENVHIVDAVPYGTRIRPKRF